MTGPLLAPDGCPRCGMGRKVCRCGVVNLTHLHATYRALVDHQLRCRACDLEHRCVEGERLARMVADARA